MSVDVLVRCGASAAFLVLLAALVVRRKQKA
jgi:hypothetical protein